MASDHTNNISEVSKLLSEIIVEETTKYPSSNQTKMASIISVKVPPNRASHQQSTPTTETASQKSNHLPMSRYITKLHGIPDTLTLSQQPENLLYNLKSTDSHLVEPAGPVEVAKPADHPSFRRHTANPYRVPNAVTYTEPPEMLLHDLKTAEVALAKKGQLLIGDCARNRQPDRESTPAAEVATWQSSAIAGRSITKQDTSIDIDSGTEDITSMSTADLSTAQVSQLDLESLDPDDIRCVFCKTVKNKYDYTWEERNKFPESKCLSCDGLASNISAFKAERLRDDMHVTPFRQGKVEKGRRWRFADAFEDTWTKVPRDWNRE